jgi:hypothetical protein
VAAGKHPVEEATGLTATQGLCPHPPRHGDTLRHFSFRTEDQYVRKIRNGEKAYAATTLPETTGAHWRMWRDLPDEAIRDHFRQWFFCENPHADQTMIKDPAPLKGLPDDD